MFSWFNIKNFLKLNWEWILVFLMFICCAIALFMWGGANQRAKEAKDQLKVEQDVGRANSNSSDIRVEDAIILENQKEELSDAISNATSPSDVRRSNGCAILRQQNQSLPPSCS